MDPPDVVQIGRQIDESRIPCSRRLRAAARERVVHANRRRLEGGMLFVVCPVDVQPSVREQASAEGARLLNPKRVGHILGGERALGQIERADAEIAGGVSALIKGHSQRLIASDRSIELYGEVDAISRGSK